MIKEVSFAKAKFESRFGTPVIVQENNSTGERFLVRSFNVSYGDYMTICGVRDATSLKSKFFVAGSAKEALEFIHGEMEMEVAA